MVDFEKAFDTINWKFLFATLKHFNFGDNFIRWVGVLYANIGSCVSNNGYISENFSLSRGIRQGCPLSSLLLLPIAEIVATLIRCNNDIKGFLI